jgi:hypothetical protein
MTHSMRGHTNVNKKNSRYNTYTHTFVKIRIGIITKKKKEEINPSLYV